MATDTVISWDDGYQLEVKNDLVKLLKGKGGVAVKGSQAEPVHISNLRPASEIDVAAKGLRKVGKDPADYYAYSSYGDNRVYRASNGFRELIAAYLADAAEARKLRIAGEAAAKDARIVGLVYRRGADVADGWQYIYDRPLFGVTPDAQKELPERELNKFVGRDIDTVAKDTGGVRGEGDGTAYYSIRWDEEGVKKLRFLAKEREAAINKTRSEEEATASAKVADAVAKAKASNAEVLIDKWTTGRCMRGASDCSFDTASRYALPNGKVVTRYRCCY